MPSKFFSATLLSFATASLFAQAPAHVQSVQAGHADIANLTGSLTQNALLTLLGAIVLMGTAIPTVAINGQGPAFCKQCGQRIFKTR